VTFTSTGTLTVSGNFSLSTGTVWNATGLITFTGTAARTITTSGTTIGASVTFSGVGGVFQLQDALTLNSARTLTVQNGRLDLNNKSATVGFFGSDFTSTRGVDYGSSGSITCIGAGGTLMSLNAGTGWTMTGTQSNNISYSGATAVTISSGAPAEATSVSFNITAGTYTLTMLAQNRNYRSINFTGFAGTVVAPFGANQIYGDLTLSSEVGFSIQASTGEVVFSGTSGLQTITSNGKTMDFPIGISCTGSTVRLADALTSGATRRMSLTVGTLDINGKTLTTGLFRAINTTTRVIAFGIGNITCIAAGGTLFDSGAITNLSFTGTPTVNISNSGAVATTVATGTPTEANSFSFNFTTGTYTLTFLAGANARSVNFTGFAGTWGARTGTSTVYGDLTLSSGMTYAASTGTLLFASTSGTKTITTNAKTIDQPVQFNGVGGTWQLQDAFTMETARALTHTNGTIDLNGKTLTVGTSYATAAGTKNLTFNSGFLVCPAATATAFNNAAPTAYTTTAGTGTGKISMTAATGKTFVGGGSTFNCTLSNDGAGALAVTGANTFLAITATVTSTMTLPVSITTSIATTSAITGTSTATLTLTSATSGTTTTINYSGTGTPRGDYLALRDLIFTPGPATDGTTPYTWYVGGNSTNNGRVSGAAFVTYPRVMYAIYNAATTSWVVPADWSTSDNEVHLIGGGGGGAGAYGISSSKVGGGGGGGGGYTKVLNYSVAGGASVSLVIGAAGTGSAGSNSGNPAAGGNGGTTSWSSGAYTAGGGGGGSTTTLISVGGTGGIGSTNNGGAGGIATRTTVATYTAGGGGGGGAGGPLGVGADGGPSSAFTTTTGGGGGGNGGGTAGLGAPNVGKGGDNFQATAGNSTPAIPAKLGGGGFGGGTSSPVTAGAGAIGYDIYNTIGGAGGNGGCGTSNGFPASVNPGSGGGGGFTAAAGWTSGTGGSAGAGGNGLIVITYMPLTATGNFFFMF
jgi:hypothetical protein